MPIKAAATIRNGESFYTSCGPTKPASRLAAITQLQILYKLFGSDCPSKPIASCQCPVPCIQAASRGSVSKRLGEASKIRSCSAALVVANRVLGTPTQSGPAGSAAPRTNGAATKSPIGIAHNTAGMAAIARPAKALVLSWRPIRGTVAGMMSARGSI